MIKSGVFDGMNLKRSVLLSVYETVIDSAVSDLKNAVEGQLDLFGMLDDVPDTSDDGFPDLPELPKRELLNYEKEYLGAYVSGHPLDGLEEEIALVSSTNILEILENENGRFAPDSKVSLGGMISKSRSQLTKRGEYMRYLSFEDLTGEIEVIVFPSQVRKLEGKLEEGNLCVISGNLDIREDGAAKVRLEKLESLADRMPSFDKLYIKTETESGEILERIKKVLRGRGGCIPVIIYCAETKQSKMAPRSMWVNDESCIEQLEKIVGEGNVKTV